MVSDTSKLRVFVNVPQNYVPSITIGTKAEIAVPEYPGPDLHATVEASAQSIDVASGTTRMQLVVDNADGQLMTGSFANVRLELPQPEVAISVPASALIFDHNGLRVATVGPTTASPSSRSRSRATWAGRSRWRRDSPRKTA